MFCISKTRADREKLVPFLESAGQIYPEMSLIFEAPKCVLPSVISIAVMTTQHKSNFTINSIASLL
jgi:hypothetical protein